MGLHGLLQGQLYVTVQNIQIHGGQSAEFLNIKVSGYYDDHRVVICVSSQIELASI
jgi:hypothetical protein